MYSKHQQVQSLIGNQHASYKNDKWSDKSLEKAMNVIINEGNKLRSTSRSFENSSNITKKPLAWEDKKQVEK